MDVGQKVTHTTPVGLGIRKQSQSHFGGEESNNRTIGKYRVRTLN